MIIKNPIGTSMGGISGYLLQVAFNLFETSKNFFSATSTISFIVFGIFVFNIKTLWQKDDIDIEIKNKVSLVEQMVKDGKINKSEAKLFYTNIVRDYLNTAVIDDKVQKNSPEFSE